MFAIPPFPGHSATSLTTDFGRSLSAGERDAVLKIMRDERVGGTFWAAQPEIPAGSVIVRDRQALEAARQLTEDGQAVLWLDRAEGGQGEALVGPCDPWHLLAEATALVVGAGDADLELIAALLGLPAYRWSDAGGLERCSGDPASFVAGLLDHVGFVSPFSGDTIGAADAARLCGFWRRLVDSNRGIGAGIGFAFWKQENVAPLLWGGAEPLAFLRTVPDKWQSGKIAVWRTRASASALATLDRQGIPLVEVEDGFLRSSGLGADCVPPLSVTVDELGAYFDPAQPSELERILQDGTFDDALIERARLLRQAIVEAGLGKYESGGAALDRPAGSRRHILVPGQVEDDRSIQTGGAGLSSNLELLRRVRADAPDAYIIYKPHPDVVAGHRTGAIPDRSSLEFADSISADAPISSLIAMVDEVHVNTSLAGFEALMRDKPVTAHGIPFYAGWGLTRDLGPVPSRRTATRNLDELVAATLLLYPRYLDPVSGLPCPAEVVVARLTADIVQDRGWLVTMRRLQGRLMRRLRGMAR